MDFPNIPNKKGTVLLIAFYNTKAMGVRYLEASLKRHGYQVATVFYKSFNSVQPQKTTDAEIRLLLSKIAEAKPSLVCLSVMSSMYIETVDAVMKGLKSSDVPFSTVCGGAYASLFPERFLEQGIDFVIRSDGERAICRLADAVYAGADYRGIPSLCYRQEDKNIKNEIGGISLSIDDYGIPAVICENACLIDNNKLVEGDPQSNTLTYEIIASRGCPFTCSYCCCVNLKRLLPDNIPAVRTRTVKSVIDELIIAKQKLKRLLFIHFYDEIFPNSPEWVDEFVSEYKKHIDLPFNIYVHPKIVNLKILKQLAAAGLTEVIMGIQSGSPRIRKEVFHRYESQEDIMSAVARIRDSGTHAVYDFMLQHPFETIENLKETYRLVEKLQTPFELQLHGLNFLPGTDIIPMAIEQGHLSSEEMDAIMYAPMQNQFSAYWGGKKDLESQLWYKLIFCLQFAPLRSRIKAYADNPVENQEQIIRIYSLGTTLFRLRHLYKKGRIVLKSIV